MAVSNVVKNYTDGTILIEDGTSVTPLSFEVTIEEGNFTSSTPNAAKTTVRDRGTIVGRRNTEQQEGSLSFTVHMREFTNATGDTIKDVVRKRNAWASMVSVAGPEYQEKLYKVTYTAAGTVHGDAADHADVYNNVELELDFSEGELNTFNITGVVLGTSTSTGPS